MKIYKVGMLWEVVNSMKNWRAKWWQRGNCVYV